jgi:hypothetical protein
VKVLSKAEVRDWFAKFPRRDTEYVQCDADGLFFTCPETSCINLEFPQKVERLPFLARTLATIGYEQQDFQGALLWFTESGVWNWLDEGVGYRIIEALHNAAGQPKSFEAGPGHLFRADELHEAVGMLLQPMIFGWDAVYVPRWSYGTDQFFLHVSHDGFVSVITRTKEFYDRAFGLLEKFQLQPEAGHEMQTQRFSRVP